tara:strand:- start:551 stop:979 length:429 start_codon:yes stop_codon:yes gene_type:complete
MLLFVLTSPEKSALASWEEKLSSEECLGYAMFAEASVFVERGGGLFWEKREDLDIAIVALRGNYMTLLWWDTISVLVSYVGRYDFLAVQIRICSFLLVAIVPLQTVEISGRGSVNANSSKRLRSDVYSSFSSWINRNSVFDR